MLQNKHRLDEPFCSSAQFILAAILPTTYLHHGNGSIQRIELRNSKFQIKSLKLHSHSLFLIFANYVFMLVLVVQVDRTTDGFHIDLDDFLTGLLLLANEMVSLRVIIFDWCGTLHFLAHPKESGAILRQKSSRKSICF